MKKDELKTQNSEIEEYKDPLGIDAMAKANGLKELTAVFEQSRADFQEILDNSALQELHDTAREINSNGMNDELSKKYATKFQEASFINGVANGKVVEASVGNWHQKQVIRLRKQLITENKLTSVTEMMAVDLAINAYFRSLNASRIYTHLVQSSDGTINLDQPRINMLKEIGKQIENANRQYLSALTLLKEIKQPQINIKVQSKQAFVGQNQQFNKNA